MGGLLNEDIEWGVLSQCDATDFPSVLKEKNNTPPQFRSFKPKTKFSKQTTKQHDIHHDHSV